MKLNGELVEKLAKEKGLTNAALGRKVGLSRQTLYKYTKGLRNCPRKKIMEIADVLDVNFLEIVKFVGSY